MLHFRFVLLQPVEATLEALEIRESTLETLEIRPTLETLELLALETLETLEMLALETLETLEMLESIGGPEQERVPMALPGLLQPGLLQPLAFLQWHPKMMQPSSPPP